MSTMRSQSGTFYKIIVTLFLLGVNHLSVSTGSRSNNLSGCNEGSSSAAVLSGATSQDEPIASASTLNAAMASIVFLKDGENVNGTEAVSSSNGTTTTTSSDGDAPAAGGPTILLEAKSEGSGKLRSAIVEPKETLLTAAQSYFIEPEQTTTTTQKPTFTRRKTRRPISSLAEKKKPVEAEYAANNEIPQGGPVPFNPFNRIVNTSFGKNRPPNKKFGRQRIARPSTVGPSTGSEAAADSKINEVSETKPDGETTRPPFSRRRPTQKPEESDAAPVAPAAQRARTFPLRRLNPVSQAGSRNRNNNNNNDNNNNRGSDSSGQERQRNFRRLRPSNSTSLTGSKPQIPAKAIPEGGFPQVRRIRPIRPLVHSRLTNPEQTPATTSGTSTTTTTTSLPVSTHHHEEESGFEDILGLGLAGINNPREYEDRPTTTSIQGLSPYPFHEISMPEHINNIINGIGPIPVPKGPIDISPLPIRPSLRAGGAGGSGSGERQGFVLRPRSSTQSPHDGDNEVSPRQQNRRRRIRPTTEAPEAVSDNQQQRQTGGIVRSRPRNQDERSSKSLRGGISDSGVARNPENNPAIRTRINLSESGNLRNQENTASLRTRLNIPEIPRSQENNPFIRTRINIPDILENEAVPVRGNRGNNNNNPGTGQLRNNPSNDGGNAAFRGGIIIQDLRGNEEVSARGSRVNGGFQRIPSNSQNSQNSNSNALRGGANNQPNLSSGNNQRTPVGNRGGNRNIGINGNPLNSQPLRGGIITPDELSQNYDDPPPLRRIPSIVQDKPRLLQTNLPFPPLPAFSNSGFPQSYQIRDEPMMQPLPIPQFKRMPDSQKVPLSPQAQLQQQQPQIPQILPIPRPVIPQSAQQLPTGPISASSGIPASNIPSSPSRQQSASNIPSSPNGLSASSNIPSSPTNLAVPIQQTLNSAMSPNNFQPGLFQVPPRDNLGFYPGLDNVLGIPNVNKPIQQRQHKPRSNLFSSRTTLVPEEVEISFNQPSASNENQAVVLSDITAYPLSANNNAADETSSLETSNPPDITTITATTSTTTTAAAPTKKLSPYEKLHPNRQAAARKFLTPRKPMEKTTSAPSSTANKPLLRKSIIPPRTLRARGKSVQQETESPAENGSDINNEASSASPPSPSEPDTASNVVPISPDQVEVAAAEQETSSRKPSLLENAKRRRIPVPSKSSSASTNQQFQQPQQQQKSRSSSSSLPTPQSHDYNVETTQPTCEEGHRYNKFLKRCVASYKPRVQG